MSTERPEIPIGLIRDFCRRHHVKKLAVFGSYLRDDFGPVSDIDLLAEFDPDPIPTLFDVAGEQQ